MMIIFFFSYFLSKTYIVIPYLNCLGETVQMGGQNVCFYTDITEIYSKLSPYKHSYLENYFIEYKNCDPSSELSQ